MRVLISILALSVLIACPSSAQLRNQTAKPIDIAGGITSAVPGSLMSFLNPNRFQMQQSVGFSYSTGGGYGGTTGMYTNSMNLRLADPLILQFNVGVMKQNFSGPKNGPQFENTQVLHGAELIYRPSKSFQMQVGYSNNPYYSGYNMMAPGAFSRPSTTGGLFEDYGFEGH